MLLSDDGLGVDLVPIDDSRADLWDGDRLSPSNRVGTLIWASGGGNTDLRACNRVKGISFRLF
jgi:hypothetical protein